MSGQIVDVTTHRQLPVGNSNNNQFEHGYALIIGIDQYANPRLSVPAVAKDVVALYATLTHPQRCGYKPGNVRLLTGAAATKKAIEEGLSWLNNKVSADSNATAIIYLSGQVLDDDGDDCYYFVPHEITDLRKVDRKCCLSDSYFADVIASMNTPRLLVMIDACHAAGLVNRMLTYPLSSFYSKSSASNTNNAFSTLATGSGRFILSSSMGDQVSWVRKGGAMSVFTYHVIDALNGKGRTNDGATAVNVLDVMGYVQAAVPDDDTFETHKRPQQPYFLAVGTSFPISLICGGQGLEKGTDPTPPTEDEIVKEYIKTLFENLVEGTLTIDGDAQFVFGDVITVGSISHSDGIAIGRDASASVDSTDDD